MCHTDLFKLLPARATRRMRLLKVVTVCVCVRACGHAGVRACVRACMCVRLSANCIPGHGIPYHLTLAHDSFYTVLYIIYVFMKVFQLHCSTEHFILTPSPHLDPIRCIFNLNSNSNFRLIAIFGEWVRGHTAYIHTTTEVIADQIRFYVQSESGTKLSFHKSKRIISSNVQNIKCTIVMST